MEAIDFIDALYGVRSHEDFGYTREEIATVLDIYFDRKDPEFFWDGGSLCDNNVVLALLRKHYDFCYTVE